MSSNIFDKECLVIAEVGQNHDGSLGLAHAFIDAVAKTGANAVKFQTHIASSESTPGEPWRVKFSYEDETRYDYWKRMEFTPEQWSGLKKHAEEKGLIFLSSAFSVEAFDLLQRLDMSLWKVPSGEVSNHELLDLFISTKKPILLSSGMSSHAEISEAVTKVRQKGNPLCLMQCTSAYPCPPEKIGLNNLADFRKRYECAVGLSDHSGSLFPALAAATLGAQAIEVHVTLSHEMFGPDVSTSLTTVQLKQLVDGVRYNETMNSHPVDKDIMADELMTLKKIFTKKIVAREDLKQGTILEQNQVVFKKSGEGISSSEINQVLGRKIIHEVKKDHPITKESLE